MAERRVKPGAQRDSISPDSNRFHPDGLSVAILSGLMIACFHFPADSTDVEAGRGLYAALVAILVATFATATMPRIRNELARNDLANHPRLDDPNLDRSQANRRWFLDRSLWLDLLPWGIALLMFVSAWATSSIGDWRKSTNEVWWWVTAAAVWVTARRCMANPLHRKTFGMLVIAAGLSLSLQAAYQHWIVLPDLWAQYQADPDTVVATAGIDAPSGSAERMVFENRLRDGGASASFALANSLAAVLVFAWLMVVTGWPHGCERSEGPKGSDHQRARIGRQRLLSGLAVVIISTGLLITRSRSAIGAVLIVTLVWIAWRYRTRLAGHGSPRALAIRLGLAAAVFALVCVMIAIFGRREWVDAAPASLATRIQYWQSTASLMADRPWTGSGPGSFQNIYEHYRAPTASEQVADPHNFFLETIVSGGSLAGILLLAWLALSFHSLIAGTSNRRGSQSATDSKSHWETDHRSWMYLGGTVGLAIAWLFRLAGGGTDQWWIYLADIVAIGWAVTWVHVGGEPHDTPQREFKGASINAPSKTSSKATDHSDSLEHSGAHQGMASVDANRSMIVFGIFGLLIHLSFSGGWTIPGIGLLFWTGMGALVGGKGVREHGILPARSQRLGTISILIVGLTLAAVVYRWSIVPVESSTSSLALAAYAQGRGNFGQASAAIQDAMHSDRFSVQAALWRAETLRWEMIQGRYPESRRHQWEEAMNSAIVRGGQSASLHREIVKQRLHLFQRHGDPQDLRAAESLLRDAVRFSPSGEWYWAQYAVVADALGMSEAAEKAARRATDLSVASGNIERELSRQLIHVPQNLGPRAMSPVQQPASEWLPRILSKSKPMDD